MDHYAVLRLSQDATPSEIKLSFRARLIRVNGAALGMRHWVDLTERVACTPLCAEEERRGGRSPAHDGIPVGAHCERRSHS